MTLRRECNAHRPASRPEVDEHYNRICFSAILAASPVAERAIRHADDGASGGIGRWPLGRGPASRRTAGNTVARILLDHADPPSNDIQGSGTGRDYCHASGERTTHCRPAAGTANPPWPIGSLRYYSAPNDAGMGVNRWKSVLHISAPRSGCPIVRRLSIETSGPCRGGQWRAGQLTVVSRITGVRLVRRRPFYDNRTVKIRDFLMTPTVIEPPVTA